MILIYVWLIHLDLNALDRFWVPNLELGFNLNKKKKPLMFLIVIDILILLLGGIVNTLKKDLKLSTFSLFFALLSAV